MAMRTGTNRRGKPGKPSGPVHRPRAKAAAATPAPPARPPSSDAWTKGKAAYEARRAAAKERPDLYPFTISGIPIKPLYTPEDLAGIDLGRDLGFPGEYP